MSKISKKLLSSIMAITMVLGCALPMGNVSAAPAKKASYAKGEAIAVLNSNATLNTASKVSSKFGKNIKYKSSFKFDNGLNITVVKSNSLSTEALIRTLEQDPSVDYAFPNYKKQASAITNDTYSAYQWALDNTGQHNGVVGADTKASAQWEAANASTEKDNVIAIVDTGVDYTHPDLKNIMWQNTYGTKLAGKYGYDFCNDDSNPIDDNGHGSHCAGIAAAQSNNDTGISGINQSGTKIMALKWLDEDGGGYTDDVIACYEYIQRAIDLGTNVVAINNSWGGYGEENEIITLKAIFDELGEKGAVSVVAAGNDGEKIEDLSGSGFASLFDEEMFVVPVQVGSDYQINVAATTSKGELVSFSNYSDKYVNVAAPGSGILSTVSYNCFNPTIYSAEKKEQLCSYYQDFDDAVAADEFCYVDTTATPGMTAELSDDYFGLGGKSLKLSFDYDRKKDNYYYVIVPFTLDNENDNYSISTMNNSRMVDCAVYDLPASATFTDHEDLIDTYWSVIDFYGYSKADDWSHAFVDMDVKSIESDTDFYHKGTDRKLVFEFTAYDDDAYIELDDIAISKQSANPDDFEKYDFYSGTSMATPYVTGAVSLVKRAAGSGYNTKDIINIVENCGRIQPDLAGKTVNGKALDLTNLSNVPPTIYSVKYSKGKVVIDGRFNDVTSLTVNGKDTQYSRNSARTRISFAGSEYLNHKVDLTISNAYGTIGKTVTLTDSKAFKEIDNAMMMSAVSGFIMPAGDITYALSADGQLNRVEYDMFSEMYFSYEDDDFSIYDLDLDGFSYYIDSAVYFNNNIYFVVKEPVMSSNECIYGYNTYFYRYDFKTTKFKKLCNLPSDDVEGGTLAVYNGAVYYIGGYNIATSAYSKDVYKLSTDNKKFDKVSSLKTGVAFAQAVQQGNRLVLVGGACSTNTPPTIQTYNGSSWKKSTVTLVSDECYNDVYFNDDTCKVFSAHIVSTENGVLCTGSFYDGLGMSFVYDPVTDAVSAYNYSYQGDKSYVVAPVTGGDIIIIEESDDPFDLFEEESTTKCYKIALNHNVAEIWEDYGNYSLAGPVSSYAEIGDKLTYKVTPDNGYIAEKLVVTNNDTGKSTSYALTNNKASFVVNASSYTVGAKVKKVSPGSISSVKVSKISGKKCTLTWSKSSNADGYIVQKYSDGDWVNVKTLDNSKTSYTVTAKTGTNKYRIRAYRTYDGTKYYTNSAAKTVYAPSKQRISSITGKKAGFTVKYTKDANATGYQIQYSKSSKMKSSKTATVSKKDTISKTVSKISSKKTYYVRVRSYKVIDGKKMYGEWSSVKSVKTK